MKTRVLLFIALALAGCGAVDSMKSGFAHSQEVAADLEKSVGTKPSVGFRWANGSLVVVTINFQGVPADKPLDKIVQLSRESVSAHFQQKPKHVVVSFTVPGE